MTRTDTRICYCASCTWWGPIQETSRAHSVPTCPKCGHVLYECQSQAHWDGIMERTVARGYPIYAAAMLWQRANDLSFPGWPELEAAYKLYLARSN